MPRCFADTNIAVYAFIDDRRTAVAEALIERGCEISVQVLNEFASVARRKLGFAWSELNDARTALQRLCPAIHPVNLATHELAMTVAQRHGLAIYDSMIVASALLARCDILYSEDMQHGMIIEGLRIENPFREMA